MRAARSRPTIRGAGTLQPGRCAGFVEPLNGPPVQTEPHSRIAWRFQGAPEYLATGPAIRSCPPHHYPGFAGVDSSRPVERGYLSRMGKPPGGRMSAKDLRLLDEAHSR